MKIRPSDLYFIHDEWLAFIFDRAVITFGAALRAELENVEGKKKEQVEYKRQQLLDKWLGNPRKFADPANRIRG